MNRTPYETNLWNKIDQFRFDEDETQFKFSQRLSRENRWSEEYTNRAIEEYKKFLFLCCVQDEPITPSDPVDQVWHLHLTYTKSYWQNLCKKTLEKDLHHNPTKGGTEEAEKFYTYYNRTHDLYKEKFGTDPPADIWQDAYTRFNDIEYERVNTQKYWLIKKPGDERITMAIWLGVVITFMILYGLFHKGIFLALTILSFAVMISRHSTANASGSGCGSGCGTDGHSGCGGDGGCSGGCGGCGGCS